MSLISCCKLLFWTLALLCTLDTTMQYNWSNLDLHNEHLPIFFTNNPDYAQLCFEDDSCPFKGYLGKPSCWGYEDNCKDNLSYTRPTCPGDHKGWVRSKEEQLNLFYKQGDFGFIKEHREQLQSYCHSDQKDGSELECSDHLHFCKAKNIYIDFRDLQHRKEPIRYHMDVLKPGQIQGHCRLNETLLQENADQISPLQSWGPELRNFVTSPSKLIDSDSCDIWVDTPTVITKIDATVNMYHHFCDFFNLYAAQHTNNSDTFTFSKDIQIIIWESYFYHSNFKSAWDAFTNRPLWTLNKVAGRRICFKEVVFPLLPRMIFGLYYNTPLVWGCENSGLFHAFSHHFLHRLGIPERKDINGKIHITFLARQSQFRRVLNHDILMDALKENDNYVVIKAEYSHTTDFKDQLQQDRWTDIFIGMHGAGLTHLLFLPDWAVIFELYNCGDANCYRDLARLRGVKYITWEDNTKLKPEDEGHHPDLGAHEKFTNYNFDVNEFIRLVTNAAAHIESHPKWLDLQRRSQLHDEL